MSINTIFNMIYKVRNFYLDTVVYTKKIQFNRNSKELLQSNRMLKDIHKGERCFILGNGPSLKKENLELLKNEIIFTVNQISRLPQYDLLNPKYHFWVDGNFFKIDMKKPEDRELLEVMSNMGNSDTICFFPLERESFCIEHGLDKKLNIHFFATKPRLTFYESFEKDIDYTKYLPGFGTVVQYCICMAIYMGFSEIYLLGCDNTGIMVTMKSALKENDENDYAYAVSDNEKRRMENLLTRHSIEQYAIDYAHTLTAYRLLYAYCKKKGIALINCSSNTVIDSIPRMGLYDVITTKENS